MAMAATGASSDSGDNYVQDIALQLLLISACTRAKCNNTNWGNSNIKGKFGIYEMEVGVGVE